MAPSSNNISQPPTNPKAPVPVSAPGPQPNPTTQPSRPVRRDNRLPSRSVPPILDSQGRFKSTAKWKDSDWEQPMAKAVERVNRKCHEAGVRLGDSPLWDRLQGVEAELADLHERGAMFPWREKLAEWERVAGELVESFEI